MLELCARRIIPGTLGPFCDLAHPFAHCVVKPPRLRVVFVLFGSAALGNGPAWWAQELLASGPECGGFRPDGETGSCL